MRRRAWLVALSLYALGIATDLTHHLIDDRHTGDAAIEFSEIAVAFSAALFWPIDIVAMALLAMR